MIEVCNQVVLKINSGGSIMWVLLILSCFIWAMMSKELETLKLKNPKGVYLSFLGKVKFLPTEVHLEQFDLLQERLNISEKIILSFISVAPLLGLLGTVGGMIETFASLETMEMFRPGGGIADGISQALLTTQLGLIVAVPSLLFFKYVQKQKRDLFSKVSEEIKLGLLK